MFVGIEVLVPETVAHLQSVASAAEVLERSFGCPAAVRRDGLARLAVQRVSVAAAEVVRPEPITGFLGMAFAACEGLCSQCFGPCVIELAEGVLVNSLDGIFLPLSWRPWLARRALDATVFVPVRPVP